MPGLHGDCGEPVQWNPTRWSPCAEFAGRLGDWRL